MMVDTNHGYAIALIQRGDVSVILWAVVIAVLVWVIFSATQRKTRNMKIPPMVDAGLFEAMNTMLSSDAPWFALLYAQKFDFQPFLVNALLPLGFVGDGDLAREILMDPKSSKPPQIYEPFNPVVGGSNVFTASTESVRWKHSRKGMAPAFSSNNVARMNRVCKEMTENMIRERLQPAMDQHYEIEICQEMLLLTFSTICKGALEYDIEPEESFEVLHEFEIANKEFFQKSNTNPCRKMPGAQWIFPEVHRAKIASARLQEFAFKVLASYRSKYYEGKDDSSQVDTVIRLVIENQNYTSDKDRAADILTLLMGGTETTAYTLAFTLLELARNPKEATKLRIAVCETPEEDWNRLPPLRNVIRESMRLHPTSAMGSVRLLGRDITVKPEMIIPKGYFMFMSPIILFRNPKVYESPDCFLPGRWDSPSKKQLETFRPFAEGKRNCLGQSLANAELHHVVGRLVKDFDFEEHDPGHLEYFMTMKPEGATMKIRRAHNNGS